MFALSSLFVFLPGDGETAWVDCAPRRGNYLQSSQGLKPLPFLVRVVPPLRGGGWLGGLFPGLSPWAIFVASLREALRAALGVACSRRSLGARRRVVASQVPKGEAPGATIILMEFSSAGPGTPIFRACSFPGPQMRGISTPPTKTCRWGPRTGGTGRGWSCGFPGAQGRGTWGNHGCGMALP